MEQQPSADRFVHREKIYVWSGTGWYEERSFMVPADHVVHELNRLRAEQFDAEDDRLVSIHDMLNAAQSARAALQLERGGKLTRRVLTLDPLNGPAAAILCAALREQRRPEEALAATERARASGYLPLLTSRAAALCDLERWEEAKAELSRVLAAGGSAEAFAVMRRIKAARPDLYPGSGP